jgi:phytanoyl-CoA hydroxylase
MGVLGKIRRRMSQVPYIGAFFGKPPIVDLTLFLGKPDWSDSANKKPWFDLPNAMDRVRVWELTGKITTSEADLLKKWVTDGYVVIDNVIPVDEIDQMNQRMDELVAGGKPVQGLTFLGMKADLGEEPKNVTHGELLRMSPEVRQEMVRASNWRVHGFYDFSKNAFNIFQNAELKRLVTLIFERDAIPFSTINFRKGSAQALHQDMAVFHVFPHNYLVGAWVACEDVSKDSGPLSYCPGSHAEPMWEGFDNYPQTMLRTASQQESDSYHQHVSELAKKYEIKHFLARKGQVLLWHGNLIHGGSKINDLSLTRKSLVIHYMTHGVNHSSHIKGPVNW